MTTNQVIGTVSDYLQAVLRFSVHDIVLFRGHRDHHWNLECNLDRLRPWRADNTLLAVEAKLVEGFKRKSLPHLRRELEDEWDVLAMAQHHGLCTRLLDWTENPLAALWFAVAVPPDGETSGVVHMFPPAPEDMSERTLRPPNKVKSTQFFQPSHLNARIVAQGGWFSVHAWSTKLHRFNRLDKIPTYKKRIVQLEIPADRFAHLRLELDRLSINSATLFPDLDGLTRHLNWQYAQAADE